MNLLNLLKKNPKLVKYYVNFGKIIMYSSTICINKFAEHLLVIQNIDPNSNPNEKLTKEIVNCFNELGFDNYDFHDDFDLSWITKSFNYFKQNNKDSHITKKQYSDLVNLSNIDLTNTCDSKNDDNPDTSNLKTEKLIKTKQNSKQGKTIKNKVSKNNKS